MIWAAAALIEAMINGARTCNGDSLRIEDMR